MAEVEVEEEEGETESTEDEAAVEEAEERPPQYDSDGDEIPDVDEINIYNNDNKANCISSDIDKVLEVYDEETCMEMMRSYYEVKINIFFTNPDFTNPDF